MRIILASLLVALAAPALSDCRIPYWKSVSVVERPAEFLATADFNEDGKIDMAGNNATSIFFAPNDGNGGLGTPVDVHSSTIRGSIVAAELTGDTHVDLLFASGNSLVVLPGNGDGTFASAVTSVTTIAPDAISVAPFDPDNDSDVVTFDRTLAALVIFTNDGVGNFSERTRMSIRANARALVTGDFDGDSRTDVVVGYPVMAMDAFYGRGDNAFDTTTILGTGSIVGLRAGDMNGDGLLDLVPVRSPFDNVLIIRNLGSRSFGDPLLYPTPESTRDHMVHDLTGDAVPDVIATGQGCVFWTLTGTPLATLGSQRTNDTHETLYCEPDAGGDVAIADFDGDGRADALVSSVTHEDFNGSPKVVLLRNLCGEGRITVTAPPVVSVGQSFTILATVRPPLGVESAARPTGSVTFREGETTLGTAALPTVLSSTASLSVSGLPLGEHTLVAAYSGDDQYEPREVPTTITVTNETTTTTLTVDPPVGVYGKRTIITANVTSSTGDTPSGPLKLFVQEWNGSNVVNGTAPTATLYGPIQTGTWTFVAEFAGDATHPPSSAALTYVIGKATPTIHFGSASAPFGQPPVVVVNLPRAQDHGDIPTGTVTITEGGVSYGTQTLDFGGYTVFRLPMLSLGRHYLHAQYSGDSNHHPADLDLAFMIFPSALQSIDARGTPEAITVTWLTNQLILRRKTPDQTWAEATYGSCCPQPPWIDTDALPEKVYLYRMEGHDGSVSHADLGMRIGFTDDPLRPGVHIKAVHLQEIVRATNIVRSAAHLSNFVLTANVGSPVITAAQMNALRNAINEARASLGAIPFSFTNVIVPGTAIRATDIQDLREAIR